MTLQPPAFLLGFALARSVFYSRTFLPGHPFPRKLIISQPLARRLRLVLFVFDFVLLEAARVNSGKGGALVNSGQRKSSPFVTGSVAR